MTEEHLNPAVAEVFCVNACNQNQVLIMAILPKSIYTGITQYFSFLLFTSACVIHIFSSVHII